MARKPRKYGETGIYHIVMRGNNQQNLFYDDADRLLFLKKLKNYIKEMSIDLYAYCLMGNHVHLLIGKGNKTMPLFIKKLACSYVYYFNHKYERCGHLFQGRYKSEPVENSEYFKTVYRYILQNPEKANICTFEAYHWSSYKHIDEKTSLLNNQFPINVFESEEKLKRFVKLRNNDICMDFFEAKVSSDSLIIAFINQLFNIKSPQQLSVMNEAAMKESLILLKKANIPINQISRLTSISRKIIKLA